MLFQRSYLSYLGISASLTFLAACSSTDVPPPEEKPNPVPETDSGIKPTPDGGLSPITDAAPPPDGKRLISIPFKLQSGDEEVGCGKAIDSIGLSSTTVNLVDARMYLHQIELQDSTGNWSRLELEQDKNWQSGDLALLDFADDTGSCQTGDARLRQEIRGYVDSKLEFHALRFVLGVPNDLNHLDASRAEAPLNASGMWWSWKGGFKYLRIDLTSQEQAIWYFHMGANSCSGTSAEGYTCVSENFANISLDHFDEKQSAVIFDLKQLYAGADVSLAADGLPGCMSGSVSDTECTPLYAALGLELRSNEAPLSIEQSAFRLSTSTQTEASTP